ncbi:MAG: hypothetical protein ACFFAY_01990 [Promethearchaeota archaeon]
MAHDDEKTLWDKGQLRKARYKALRGTRQLRDNERALVEIIQSLDSNYENLVVIVEGKRDERVLRELGLRAPIVRTQTGKSREQFIKHLISEIGENGQVLILTDFDEEGETLQSFIERELELERARVLRRVRGEIGRVMGNFSCIEELVALFKRRDSPEPRFQ